MASKIKFVKELPQTVSPVRGSRGAAWRVELRQRPGEWALVYTGKDLSASWEAEHSYSTAKNFAGQYEIERRGLEVYARYVGEPVK